MTQRSVSAERMLAFRLRGAGKVPRPWLRDEMRGRGYRSLSLMISTLEDRRTVCRTARVVSLTSSDRAVPCPDRRLARMCASEAGSSRGVRACPAERPRGSPGLVTTASSAARARKRAERGATRRNRTCGRGDGPRCLALITDSFTSRPRSVRRRVERMSPGRRPRAARVASREARSDGRPRARTPARRRSLHQPKQRRRGARFVIGP